MRTQVYGATVMPTVRHRCLATITKMLYFTTPEQLQEILQELPMSCFIASLLSGRDARAQAYGLQMAEILMQQLPEVFQNFFAKEGVVYALAQLAGQASSSSPEGGEEDKKEGAATAAAAGTAAAAAAAGGGSDGDDKAGGSGARPARMTRSQLQAQVCKPHAAAIALILDLARMQYVSAPAALLRAAGRLTKRG